MGGFGRNQRIGRYLCDRENGKDIPEQLRQRLDMCKNTVCCAGVSHSSGLESARKFLETSEGKLKQGAQKSCYWNKIKPPHIH